LDCINQLNHTFLNTGHLKIIDFGAACFLKDANAQNINYSIRPLYTLEGSFDFISPYHLTMLNVYQIGAFGWKAPEMLVAFDRQKNGIAGEVTNLAIWITYKLALSDNSIYIGLWNVC